MAFQKLFSDVSVRKHSPDYVHCLEKLVGC